jgi:uncharacterized HNH endonuclease L245|nr:MAG TPA: homing endonuclease [Caudoviricetes sp.]
MSKKLESVLRFNNEFFIVPNFEKYAVSKDGKLYNLDKEKLVSTYIGIDNYEHCVLYMRGKKYRKRVHRLMGKVFLGNPQVVNHKDGNKSNNNLSNLERSTHRDNIKHAYDTGAYYNKYKVSVVVINKITGEETMCKSMREAERFTGVDRHRIKTFLKGTRNNLTNWEFHY